MLFGDPELNYLAAIPLQAEPFERALCPHVAHNELFYTGMAGDHRRIWSYELYPGSFTLDLQDIRAFASMATVVVLAFQPIFIFKFFWSLRRGPKAGDNPWKANTLEWQAPSPPPHGNFAEMPRVYRGPYEYSHPDRKEDYWPQNASA